MKLLGFTLGPCSLRSSSSPVPPNGQRNITIHDVHVHADVYQWSDMGLRLDLALAVSSEFYKTLDALS